jgi:hypothetical protein
MREVDSGLKAPIKNVEDLAGDHLADHVPGSRG